MKFPLKIAVIPIIFIFLVACNSSPTNAIPQTQSSSAEQVDILTITKTPSPTFTPKPTNTSTPTLMATSTPLPTKEVLLQFGVFGGDGGARTDYHFGRDTPKLILYTDGQLLIQKKDDNGIWFVETRLTIPQICSFLSQIEKTGFFDNETYESMYKFDDTTQFGDGAANYIIQVNGDRHKQMSINYEYVPYLVPEVKRVFDLFSNYSPPSKLTDYQAEHMLLWVEKGLGDSIYSTPAPIRQTWPADLPSLDILEKNEIKMLAYPENDNAKPVFQVLIDGEDVKPIFEVFGNRLAYRLFQTENSEYYVIARPLLPHEPLYDISPYPRDKEFDLPFKCTNR